MKRIYILVGVLMITLLLSACNQRVTNRKYSEIELSMTIEEVIAILGEPNDVSNYVGIIVYFWFDKANSVEDAITKTDNGKEITYICIYFGTASSGDYVVQEKTRDVWTNQ